MTTPLVTIAVSPRERFSFAQQSLEKLWARTNERHELVYIDAGSPPLLQHWLNRQAQSRDFHLLRFGEYLSPSIARNLAARVCTTRYIAFVDNDMLVSPGWLDRLVQAAEATGAGAVGPLICEGLPEGETILAAGGELSIVEGDAGRQLSTSRHLVGSYVGLGRPMLRRMATQLLRGDCLLVRREALEQVGMFDEQLLSTREDADLCLRLSAAGWPIVLEPAARATYVGPLPLRKSDRAFFSLRWSDGWNRSSLDHFARKWNLREDDPATSDELARLDSHRRQLLHPLKRLLLPFGRRRTRELERRWLAPIELRLNRRWYPRAA
jgi:GT2 family glycosyltransferase